MTNDPSQGSTDATGEDRLKARTLGVSLTVNDLERSLVWYRDVVGFDVDQRYEREGRLMAVALAAGDVKILLTPDDGRRGERKKGEGFSMQLITPQNVDGIAARIRASGGVLETEPADVWGARAFRLRDPDGFLWVISSGR